LNLILSTFTFSNLTYLLQSELQVKEEHLVGGREVEDEGPSEKVLKSDLAFSAGNDNQVSGFA
jgi:hypothetical protein